ncbi:MdtA/MuxA family multidrug efflux RND transporter periplasmic adaptor subunit [Candidatus Arsenophonus nilaparvatae]|uniref:MdtA/MuxA family multidrug efflux RND transporter periplasmic adaptor subunit n=1 Tax=Candidatus Arsenophonus nilaparvatae TaxID=1247023 RepID=UPI000509FDF7
MNNNNHRRKIVISAIAIIFLSLSGVFAWRYFHSQTPTTAALSSTQVSKQSSTKSRKTPLPPVQAALSVRQSIPHILTALGTVQAANTVMVTSRVQGQLMALHFTEGQTVKAGDLLAEIDPRPFQISLAQAEGQLLKDQAQLHNARQDLARYQKLATSKVISQQELDKQRTLVQQTEGSVKIDQAAISNAKLQLTYSRITAPIAGRVGLKQIDIGNYITSGSTSPIVIITQTTPIDAVFALPEVDIPLIKIAQQQKTKIPVIAWDRNNSAKIAAGYLLSTDNQIDSTTGTLKMKARFANQDNRLFPNQFINIQIQVNTLKNVVVIPTAALQMGSIGHFVWTLDKNNLVKKYKVTVGLQDGQKTIINAGLDAGVLVVTDGVDRLVDGVKVQLVTPKDQLTSYANTTEKS